MATGVYKRNPIHEKRRLELAAIGRSKLTEEDKKNWRLFKKGHKGHWLGKKMSEETRRRMSVSHLKEKAPNWKGGITPINQKIRQSLDYRLWREAVFKRDVFTCQECKQVGGQLNADHIKPFSLFPELRFAIDNGRTLCEPCHKKTDSYGWKMTNNRLTANDFIK